jgi:DNA-binding transcriptional MocR family regulator
MIDTLKLIRAVINTDLKQSEKITLIACIYKVDWKSWRADYPISVKSLSVESGLGLRTVTRALQVLEEKNYIKRVGTHRAGGQWASTLELLPSTILPPAKLPPPPCQIDTTPCQIDTTPCQIDTTPCQIDGRIYPINSKPIKSSNGNLDPVLKTNSAVNSMADYLKRRELENQEWNIRKKGILR